MAHDEGSQGREMIDNFTLCAAVFAAGVFGLFAQWAFQIHRSNRKERRSG